MAEGAELARERGNIEDEQHVRKEPGPGTRASSLVIRRAARSAGESAAPADRAITASSGTARESGMSRRSGCPRSRQRGTLARICREGSSEANSRMAAGSGCRTRAPGSWPRRARVGRLTSMAAATGHAQLTTSTRSCESTSSPRLAPSGSPPSAAAMFSRWSTSSLPELSGSRVRSIVNGLRSLYRWAQDRELTSHDPAALVRLPAMDATPVERVASPAEFARLLAVLEPQDALPYALAGYGMGRRAQIVRLRWPEVDLKVGALEWGIEWEARKYEASRRVVPVVPPLLVLLKSVYLEQGRPKEGLVCPPHTEWALTGLLNTGWLAKRAGHTWTSPLCQRPVRRSPSRYL